MRGRVALLASFLVWASACWAVSAANALTLYERFPVPASLDTWQPYSLRLAPDLWLVAPTAADIGSPSGSPASVAEIQAVLGSLAAVEIGGVCTSTTIGATTYPCGFALDNASLAGIALENFDSGQNGWKGTENRVTRGINWSSSGGNPGGEISIQPFGTGTALVTLLAPSAFLGNESAAYGGTLSFDLLTLSNIYQPVSYSYGVAILSTPEPTAGVLVLTVLGALGVWRRRTLPQD